MRFFFKWNILWICFLPLCRNCSNNHKFKHVFKKKQLKYIPAWAAPRFKEYNPVRCLTHRSVWEVQHRLEEELVGRWAGWRRLWSIYKPRPKQNFFQPPSHLPDPQTKAEDGGGGGGGGEGRGGEARLHCPAEKELGLLPAPWPASPWNSKNILRAERRDASLFISPSFSTLLFLPSSFQREAFHLYLLTSLSVVRL